MKTCSVDKCEKPARANTLCVMHNRRWKLYGDVNYCNANPTKGKGTKSFKSGLPCIFEGCDGQRFCRSWCAMHYYRWKKFGDPAFTPQPRPKNGQGKGQRIDGRYQTPHRLAYLKNTGPIPNCTCEKAESMHVRTDKDGNVVLHSEADQARDVFTKWHGCKVEGCDSTHLRGGSHGYCKRHYTQMNTHGRIISVEKMPRGERHLYPRPPHLRGKNSIPSTFDSLILSRKVTELIK